MTTASSPYRVLIVDDSAVVRQALSLIINETEGLEVMAVAADPFEAAEKIRDEVPDVITLDVEMPRMDGISFLRKLMAQRPIPVVICSSLVLEGSKTLSAALDAGAVDLILKPKLNVGTELEEARVLVGDTVRAAAMSGTPGKIRKPIGTSGPPPTSRPGPSLTQAPERSGQPVGRIEKKLSADVILPPAPPRPNMPRSRDRVIAIGASTGGTEALRVLLETMPIDCPPIVIVQHMPEGFTAAFARRLDQICDVSTKEAKDGDLCRRGQVLIAPGARHLLLTKTGEDYAVSVRDGDLVSRHRPSADVLFRSVAQVAGPNAVGVIMTGMGDDGAQGLLEMRAAGADTLGQSARSCVIYGMPQAAMKLGAVTAEHDLTDLTRAIMSLEKMKPVLGARAGL